jgi:hypothetical protein
MSKVCGPIGLDWELSHQVSKCESCKIIMSSFKIQVSQDAKILGSQSEDSLPPLYVITEGPPNCDVHYRT